jgi:hypothetical protein
LLLAPGLLVRPAAASERLPLHWLWHERQRDSAYAVSAERRAWLVRERGYVDMGILAYVDGQPVAHARPLVCQYAPAPRTDTFCAISSIELRIMRRKHYEDVATEGYVQRQRVPGSVPLFRMFRAHGGGPDHEHRFVVSDEDLVRLRHHGWSYEGVKGYVYPAP